MRKLNITQEEAETCNKYVPEIDAWYFWNPNRGGKSMIVNKTGEFLIAPSSVNFDKHVKEFENGRRN